MTRIWAGFLEDLGSIPGKGTTLLSSKASRPALELTELTVQWTVGAV
jgi:hypothetical protein